MSYRRRHCRSGNHTDANRRWYRRLGCSRASALSTAILASTRRNRRLMPRRDAVAPGSDTSGRGLWAPAVGAGVRWSANSGGLLGRRVGRGRRRPPGRWRSGPVAASAVGGIRPTPGPAPPGWVPSDCPAVVTPDQVFWEGAGGQAHPVRIGWRRWVRRQAPPPARRPAAAAPRPMLRLRRRLKRPAEHR